MSSVQFLCLHFFLSSRVVFPHSFPEHSPIKRNQATTLPRPHLTLMCQRVFELATLGPPNKPCSPQRHPGDTEKGLCFSYLVDRGVFIAVLMHCCKINKHIHIQTCLLTLSPSAFWLQSKNSLRKGKCVTCALSAQHFDFRLLFKQFSLFDPQLLQRVSWGLNSQPYAHLGRLLTVWVVWATRA